MRPVNDEPLSPRWLRSWAADITTHLQAVLSAFDTYYPFPPGANEVILAGAGQSSLAALRAHPGTPPDLLTFYAVITEVTMSDIGNAFFIHAADDVVTRLAEGPVLLGDGHTGTIFASDGGGTLYAVDPGNRVHRSHVASPDGGFGLVAADLRGFLGKVRDAVAQFVETRTPGDL
jgi:hypothetical protein